jgi:hypothetical protein
MNEVHIHPLEAWGPDWRWGIPLIVMCISMHIYGLAVIRHYIARREPRHAGSGGHFELHNVIKLHVVLLSVTILHTLEALVWSMAYLLLGAVTNYPDAVLFSMEAITSYGHTAINLPPHWRMMGSLEALNGVILFGLTTGFLFAELQASAVFHRDAKVDKRNPQHGHDTPHDNHNPPKHG